MEERKEFKSFIKVAGGSEAQLCHYPFKLDTYGKGCCNGCKYCFAKSVLDFRKLWDEENPSPANYENIEKLFIDVFEKDKKRNKFYDLMINRIPIRLGGMTDCFSKIEQSEQITYKLLKLFDKYNYPYLILTKNTLIATDKYIEVLNKDLAVIQFSVTTPYDDKSLIMEYGAESTSERLKAIKKLTDLGFYVEARINPLFPIHKDGYFTNKHTDDKKLDYFDWSLVDKICDVGAKTVIAGFLRLSNWNIKWIKESTGEDYTWLFDENEKHKNTALHFSTEEKRYYYERIKDVCDKRGVEFSVCYDGDEDWETFKYLWANQDDCCNALGKVKGFKNNYLHK